MSKKILPTLLLTLTMGQASPGVCAQPSSDPCGDCTIYAIEERRSCIGLPEPADEACMAKADKGESQCRTEHHCK